jgi:hypothetical protein
MSSLEDKINWYITEAKKIDGVGIISWIVPEEIINQVVLAFQKACPKIKYHISRDWDDDNLLHLDFEWEPGTLDKKVIPLKPAPIVEKPPRPKNTGRW